MTTFPSSAATRVVAVPVELFAALQQGAVESGNPAALDLVRDAGYRAGQALFDGFGGWLFEHGERAPDALPQDTFMRLAGSYFSELGWGELAFSPLGDAVVAIDADGWGECAAGGCLLSTGMLSGFFGRVAEAPIAVLEVECAGAGAARCRFLLGSIDVLGYVHEAMGRGIPYQSAVASA